MDIHTKIPSNIAIGIILSISIIIGLPLWLQNKRDTTTPNLQQELAIQAQQNPNLTTNPITSPKKVGGISTSERCILKKTTDGNEEVVFSSDYCSLGIKKWNDYLIFSEGDGYQDEDVKIVIYNLKTSERKEIFNLKDYTEDTNRDNPPIEATPNYIFGSTLFFSAGGYMTDAMLYSFSLSDLNSSPKLIDSELTGIEYSDGHYWLTESIGDAGYASSTRSLFDIDKEKIIGHAITTEYDNGNGTEYLGADENNAFISSFKLEEINDIGQMSVISEMLSVSLFEKNKQKSIISKQEMPADIYRAVYDYNTKTIVLLGKNAYTYDIVKKTLKKIASLNTIDIADIINDSNKVSKNTVCLTEDSSLNFLTGAIDLNEKNCHIDEQDNKTAVENALKEFNLPSEYSFER